MATKKLTPVEESKTPSNDDLELLRKKLEHVTQYMERIDWKLWMIMNMVREIGQENGYKFNFYNDPSSMNSVESIEKDN